MIKTIEIQVQTSLWGKGYSSPLLLEELIDTSSNMEIFFYLKYRLKVWWNSVLFVLKVQYVRLKKKHVYKHDGT